MTLYYLKQDDTIPGCGESGCCGEYYEEISESFVDCTHKVEVDADHLHGCNGGGPVLKWRKATPLEVIAHQSGVDNSYLDGYDAGWDFGIKDTEKRIIKLLESGEHVVQFEFENRVFKSAWKQKCRCGYYGVFNEHLSALIRGEKLGMNPHFTVIDELKGDK